MRRRRSANAQINLSSNELIHPAVEPILAEVLAQLKPSLFRRYPNVAESVDMLAAHLGRSPDELILVPGSDSVLRVICRQYLLSRGSRNRLLLQYPNYFAWEQTAELLGLNLTRINWSDYHNQGRELLEAASACSGALIAVSAPNGTVAGCLSVTELEQLTKVVREHDHLLVIDSCYQAFNGGFADYIGRAGEQVLVVQSLSKSHGLAGARLGLLCGPRRQISELSRYRLEHAVSSAAIAFIPTVVERNYEFERVWQDIRDSREKALRILDAEGFRSLPSRGNYVAFRVASTQIAHNAVARVAQCGYRIRHLAEFSEFADCLRVTVGDWNSTRTALEKILEVLAAERIRRRTR